jgi:hypothetical protein
MPRHQTACRAISRALLLVRGVPQRLAGEAIESPCLTVSREVNRKLMQVLRLIHAADYQAA